MPIKTVIRLLPGNVEKIKIQHTKIKEKGGLMSQVTRMSSPIMLGFTLNDTPARQVVEDGETYNVYMIEEVHTSNLSGRNYHLMLNVAGVVVYEDQLPSGQEKLVVLSVPEQFEYWEIGFSLGTTG